MVKPTRAPQRDGLIVRLAMLGAVLAAAGRCSGSSPGPQGSLPHPNASSSGASSASSVQPSNANEDAGAPPSLLGADAGAASSSDVCAGSKPVPHPFEGILRTARCEQEMFLK